MIHKDEDEYFVECDICAHCENTEESNFNRAIDSIKSEGWKLLKAKGKWYHFCTRACFNDFYEQNL